MKKEEITKERKPKTIAQFNVTIILSSEYCNDE